MKCLIEFTKNLCLAVAMAAAVVLALVALSLVLPMVQGAPIELREVSVNYKDFLPGGSDPLITQNGLPDRTLGSELNLNVNTDVLKYLYWNNMVHSMTDAMSNGDKGQFRVVGLSMKLGARVTPWLDVGYSHFSQHLLDTTYAAGRFPLQDAVEMNLYLYNGNSRGKSIF